MNTFSFFYITYPINRKSNSQLYWLRNWGQWKIHYLANILVTGKLWQLLYTEHYLWRIVSKSNAIFKTNSGNITIMQNEVLSSRPQKTLPIWNVTVTICIPKWTSKQNVDIISLWGGFMCTHPQQQVSLTVAIWRSYPEAQEDLRPCYHQEQSLLQIMQR